MNERIDLDKLEPSELRNLGSFPYLKAELQQMNERFVAAMGRGDPGWPRTTSASWDRSHARNQKTVVRSYGALAPSASLCFKL